MVVIAVDTVKGICDPVPVVDEGVEMISMRLDGTSVVEISVIVEILGMVVISVVDEGVVIVGVELDGISVV